MKDKETFRPGEKVPKSGQYGVYGARGAYQGYEVTSTKNEPFSPTLKPNQHFVMHDPTKHKH